MTDRRKFLRDVAAAGGLVAVAASGAASGVTPQAATPAPPADKPAGYRVTAHVSKYYDKART